MKINYKVKVFERPKVGDWCVKMTNNKLIWEKAYKVMKIKGKDVKIWVLKSISLATYNLDDLIKVDNPDVRYPKLTYHED